MFKLVNISARKIVLVTIFILLALIFMAAKPSGEGTVALESTDLHYGDTATVTYQVERRHREMIGALLCRQDGGWYNLILERGLDKHEYDGTMTFLLANGQGGLNHNLPPLDYSIPARCVTYVFSEPQSPSQSGQFLTNILQFTVNE